MNKKPLISLLFAFILTLSGCGKSGTNTETPEKTSSYSSVPSDTSSVLPTPSNPSSSMGQSSSSSSTQSSASSSSVVTLTGIDLSGDYPLVFEVGDPFSYEGLIVTASYSDSTQVEVTGYTVSPTHPTETAGQKKITVSYSEGGISVSESYFITVNDKSINPENVLVGIRIDVSAVKRSFIINEQFSYEGLIVTAIYADAYSKTVTPSNVYGHDMSTVGTKTVVVEYQEAGILASSSYKIVVHEATHADESVIRQAAAELHAAFSELDVEDYGEARWAILLDKLAEADDAIRNASSNEEVQQILQGAIHYFENAPRSRDAAKGTYFDYQSPEANYEFDRDEENHLVIMYPSYPGRWVYCGTKTNLHTDTAINNTFTLKFRNDVEQTIQVCLQLTDDSGQYKLDSRVMSVGPKESKTITFEYEVNVTRLYFFLDSCSEHNHGGQVTILSAELSFTERAVELLDPKTILVDQALTREDKGANTYYSLLEADTPLYIERISFKLEVIYNGNSDGGKWFGVRLYAGKYSSDQLSDSMGYAQSIDGGDNFIFNYEIDGVLSVGDTIHAQIAYGAGPDKDFNELSYKLVSYTFHYGTRKRVASETLNVNQYIWKDGASKVGEEKLKVTVPFASFATRSRIIKAAINFTTINKASYGKSQIYVTGLGFTNFPSGNNNILNIGSQMLKDKTGTPQSGSSLLYPTENVMMTENGALTLECWWSCAEDILIDSITIFSDSVAKPGEVSSLEGHPIDGGVVLTWVAGSEASSYQVYKDGALLDSTTACYYTAVDLINGQSYEFTVVAVNAVGSSEGVSIHVSPDAEGTFDTFIENMNTPFEQYLGQERIGKVLEGGNYYLAQSNNHRFKKAIDKMQSGQQTNVVYMGGSITVGETAAAKDDRDHQKGYAYYSYQWLKRNYDPHGVSNFVNASISGTGSEVGITRLERDVIDHDPDIVFLECAANNGSTEYYRSTYESVIRRLLTSPTAPAVVLVFSCTYYTGPSNGPEYLYMNAIGNHYGLPMYSFDRGFRSICTPSRQDGVVGDEIYAKFSDDGTHPNDEGHQLYAKGLCYYLRALINKPTDDEPTYPATPCNGYGNKYENYRAIDNTNSGELITSLGGFVAANTATNSTSNQSDVTGFQKGWKKASGSSLDAMRISVTAKNFILVYAAGNKSVAGDPNGIITVSYANKNDANDKGTISWDVSKAVKQGTNGSNAITSESSGWGNPVAVWLFDKEAAGEYDITIQMGQTADVCVIMSFGYTA